MELFKISFSCFPFVTIAIKSSILDLADIVDPTLITRSAEVDRNEFEADFPFM